MRGVSAIWTCYGKWGPILAISDQRIENEEEIGTLSIASSRLYGIEINAKRIPSMIDEIPILAMAAACAVGETVFHGLAELRFKESDRLVAIAEGLVKCGVTASVIGDSLVVIGAWWKAARWWSCPFVSRPPHRYVVSRAGADF